ncbi:MAG: hypothetical protein HY231_00225 [Acidobacteria bacterium]|nr:hypothetical protein [Acidobacteriota bacterium]
MKPIFLFTIFFLFLPLTIFGHQSAAFAAGQVIENVTCKADASVSYALYLPSHYTAQKKWPILYGFDPGARGLLPVQHFKEAAEQYGYIVIGSNDSRNGPGVNLNKIVSTLWNDTHERFAIDNHRVYTTGFSGGARVASAVAYSLQGIAGVIACGAGFHQNIAPSKTLPFAFFATIGSEDFNMPELRTLDRALDDFNIPHRLVIFDGDHRWASSALCVEAIEWMELQAMKNARAPKNELLIDDLLKKRRAQAKALQAAQQWYQAYAIYAEIAADFKGLREVTEFENQAQQLRDNKAVKAAFKQQRDEDQQQMKIIRELLTLKEALKEVDNRAVTLSQLKSSIAILKKQADGKENSSERLVTRRALSTFFANCFEGAQALMFEKNYHAAATNLELAALVRADGGGIFFSLARAYALNGDQRKALEALKTAVAKGFSDAAMIEKNEAFNGLRDDAEFHKIVDGLKKKP